MAADAVGPAARVAVDALRPGGIVMLENLRFDEGETSKDDARRAVFADGLAALADQYVSDGFGVVHRKHASVYDVALRLPHAAGYLIQAEVAALTQLTAEIRRPYVVLLGGAKVQDKIGALGGLIKRADRILVGGAMAFPFLAARGFKVGTSLLDPADIAVAVTCLSQAARAGVPVELPSDVIVAAGRSADAEHELVSVDVIPPDLMALDIGPQTARSFSAAICEAATVFWNGPMGVFELAPYAEGTRTVIAAMNGGGAFTVVGGGDTTAAIHELGFTETAFGYVSTGGGASLEYIEGKTLPGLAVLED